MPVSSSVSRSAGLVLLFIALQMSTGSALASACPMRAGRDTCVIRPSKVTYNASTRQLWLLFPTQRLPRSARLRAATLRLSTTGSAAVLRRSRFVQSLGPGSLLLFTRRGLVTRTLRLASARTMRQTSRTSARNNSLTASIRPVRLLKAALTTAFGVRVTAGTRSVTQTTPVALLARRCVRTVRPGVNRCQGSRVRFTRRGGQRLIRKGRAAPQLTVTYTMAASPVARRASTPTGGQCNSSLTPDSGTPFCDAGQSAPAAINVPMVAGAPLAPNSATVTALLDQGQHNADFVDYGTTVFDAAAGTGAHAITCTETSWGRCPLADQSIAVNPSWKPSSGSDHAMVVIDYSSRRVYDLWQVATHPDGTVALAGDGSVTVGWGDVTSLDGNGQSAGATGSGLSHLYGMVRIFEAQRAIASGGCDSQTDCALAGAIPHALHIGTDLTCSTYVAPAIKSDGTNSGSGCLPEGTHLFLDPNANCAFDRAQPIEEAVCFALKRYGAFMTDSAGSRFAIGFEGSSYGEPGGSGPSRYAAGGLKWDYYDMKGIPWLYLRVAAG